MLSLAALPCHRPPMMRSENAAADERAAMASEALNRLRSATAMCHRRLEKRLGIAERFASLAAYRSYLEVVFGFYDAFETSLQNHPVQNVLTDHAARRKTPLLIRDLKVLGATSASIAAIERCSQIPRCPTEAAALGSLYVLEGATLGGRVLFPMVERRLSLTPERGAS